MLNAEFVSASQRFRACGDKNERRLLFVRQGFWMMDITNQMLTHEYMNGVSAKPPNLKDRATQAVVPTGPE